MRVATDVGGTFTDLVYFDEETGRSGTVKVDTTPPDFERGVIDGLRKSGLDTSEIELFAHGTTVVINALTERRGAKTGLVTTRGFRDVLEIARGNRPDLYNFYFSKPKPFVPRYLRKEVDERLDHKGEVLAPLDPESLEPVADYFREEGVEAVAVCFVHSYANPTHELEAARVLEGLLPGVSVVPAHHITREWREYERTNTAVLSAYVHPAANGYLDSLERKLDRDGFGGRLFVMQSNGGSATVRAARSNPIAMVESGPVGGVLGAAALGELIGEPNIITLDIGGTTAKCSLVQNGEVQVNTEYKIERSRTNPGYPIQMPVIDIVEIGNGGGSIAWVDEAGGLHVGPRSAGALPGPAAYGRGGEEPTTTDANLLAGRIDADYFLGGEITPDMDNVRKALSKLADGLGSSIEETARGVIRLANANMVNALKLVSLNRGHDPQDFSLVAFGGGGPMHAAFLAEELRIRKVVVPTDCAVFSAWGMLRTDLRRDYVRTRVTRLDLASVEEVGEAFRVLQRAAAEEFGEDGVGPERLVFNRYADMRYLGQEHTVKVPFPTGEIDTEELGEATRRFHEAHEREYAFRLDSPVEIVNYHLAAYGAVQKPEVAALQRTGRSPEDAIRGRREVDFDAYGVHQANIYDRALLEPEAEFSGPAVIEEPATTIVVLPGHRVVVDDYGNLHIHPEQRKHG
jgi:N-methylhydantoinase A